MSLAELEGLSGAGRTPIREALRMLEQEGLVITVPNRGGTIAPWIVDILVRDVAIEYDGAYWHADKVALDTDKSLDLLAAGLGVIRLREHPLPPLQIDDPLSAEFTVPLNASRFSSAPIRRG